MSGALQGFPELDVNQYQAPDLLGMARNAAALKGQLNQNQAFAAQSAQSQIYAKSLNPDGTLNAPQYTSAVAANPTAASYGAQEAYGKAQEVNNALLQGTGMGLQQHITRLSTLATSLQALNTSNNGQGIPANQFKDAILTELRNGLIDPNEAASVYADVSKDPLANAQKVRDLYAGVSSNLQMITPLYNTLTTGAGTVPIQTNAGAAGGASIPAVTNGLSASELAQPFHYTNGNNQTVNTTLGAYLQSQGISTSPQMSAGVGGAAVNPLSGLPGIAQPQLPIIGGGVQGAGAAPQPLPQAQVGVQAASTGAPGIGGAQPGPQPPQPGAMSQGAPGTGGKPIMGPAPGVPEMQHQSETMYQQDQQDASTLAPRISALQELAAAAPGAQTGPAAQDLARLRGLAQEFNLPIGTTQASQEQVMNKATNMLVTNGVSGLGQPTDAKMLQVVGATPNSTMTPEAVQSTVAMTYGSLLYQQNLAQAAQRWIGSGGSPAQYAQFKIMYQQTAPSPLVLSMPYMPPSAMLSLGKYIKTLPAKDQRQINSQIEIMSQMNSAAANANGQ